MIYLLNNIGKFSIIETHKRYGKITKLYSPKSSLTKTANFDHNFFGYQMNTKINFYNFHNIIGDFIYWVYLS